MQDRTTLLYRALDQRILLLDGGFGTMVQPYGLTETEFRGTEFADWPTPLKGCNDLLAMTRPAVVREIHEKYLQAGADIVTFHYEATSDPKGCIDLIRRAGAKAGISIKPATPVEVLDELLPTLDLVLVMSVEPGFGGQSFIPESLDRIARLRRMIEARGCATVIEVDGGISAANARAVFEAGAEALVAGSAVFGAADPEAEIVKMLEA